MRIRGLDGTEGKRSGLGFHNRNPSLSPAGPAAMAEIHVLILLPFLHVGKLRLTKLGSHWLQLKPPMEGRRKVTLCEGPQRTLRSPVSLGRLRGKTWGRQGKQRDRDGRRCGLGQWRASRARSSGCRLPARQHDLRGGPRLPEPDLRPHRGRARRSLRNERMKSTSL